VTLDMNWTLAQAAQHAREIVSSTCGEIEAAIIDEATQEFDVGWIFFYQSSRFLETGDVQDSLAETHRCSLVKDGQAAFISYQRQLLSRLTPTAYVEIRTHTKNRKSGLGDG